AGVEPRARFKALLRQYAGGYLHGPFNLQARLLAGFDEDELADLVEQAGWRIKSGEQTAASRCQVGADGALRTAVDAWSMPIPTL
ncbi:hypothetical protein BXO582_10060, partial [Xanthomonas oryzae pv. oryzae]